jgi:hypothetical protein
MPEINIDMTLGVSYLDHCSYTVDSVWLVADRMVFKKLQGKGREGRTGRERPRTAMEGKVEISMKAEENTMDRGRHEFRKILMKANYGNRKTLPKDRHKRLEELLISSTENTAP